MEVFHTEDGSVAKMIHLDGSETSVKIVKSCSNFRDETGRVQTQWVDRNKYSVFISSSLGCYMQCPFCHLTIKGSRYRKLAIDQVVANVKEAIESEIALRPDMAERYVKLCWMGMGDAVNNPDMVFEATLSLMEWLMEKNYARGLDCADLSTVLPPVGDAWLEVFPKLTAALAKYPQNPASFQVEQAEIATHLSYEARTPFRVFWSIHSAIQATRDKMVPNAMPLAEAIPRMEQLARQGTNVLLHQLFVEGLNDSEAEVDALLAVLGQHFPEQELRVLRYNFCDRSPFREWDHIDHAVSRIADQHARVKVQTSAGKEVAAACGQFLVSAPRSVKGFIPVIPVPSKEHEPIRLGT